MIDPLDRMTSEDFVYTWMSISDRLTLNFDDFAWNQLFKFCDSGLLVTFVCMRNVSFTCIALFVILNAVLAYDIENVFWRIICRLTKL